MLEEQPSPKRKTGVFIHCEGCEHHHSSDIRKCPRTGSELEPTQKCLVSLDDLEECLEKICPILAFLEKRNSS